jgi:hypothetical protein
MRRSIQLSLFIGLLLSSPLALAEWSSGGGKLKTDAENPWFLKNTKVIRYCIAVDPINFGTSETVARNNLHKALYFWKNELLNTVPVDNNGVEILVGTQSFQEVGCHRSHEIAFQFGSLTRYQQAKIGDVKRYGALTIRTEYDNVNLRAKGFVYISPEQGPLAPTLPNLIPNRWSVADGRLLELTLIHELGHVFGIPDRKPYMNEDFVDWILGPAGRWMSRSQNNPSFFKVENGHSAAVCHGLGDRGEKILKIPSSWKCVKIENSDTGLLVYAAPDRHTSFTLIGTIFSVGGSQSAEHIGQMWLPAEQIIFPEFSGVQTSMNIFHTWSSKNWGKFRHVDYGVLDSSLIYSTSPEGFDFDAIDDVGNVIVNFLFMGPYQYPLDMWGN